MPLHHRKVYRVARRKATVSEDDLFRSINDREVDWEYFVDNFQKSVERGLDVVVTIEGTVTMNDFLKRFRIGDKAPAFVD